jgi:hypothetical protein
LLLDMDSQSLAPGLIDAQTELGNLCKTVASEGRLRVAGAEEPEFTWM